MRLKSSLGALFTVTGLVCCSSYPQTSPSVSANLPTYGLTISVDEVVLSFHAADSYGLPINDLKLDELSLLDNGKRPTKILDFRTLQDVPIRAGILLDTSPSMEPYMSRNRAISIAYAQRILRRGTDQAFVMDFARHAQIVQPWSDDPNELMAGIHKLSTFGGSHLQGTAIFDALYRVCSSQIGTIIHSQTGNFILLFSDGADNASQTSQEEAVKACQSTNTRVFTFYARPESHQVTFGEKTLQDLASLTGGRLFPLEETEEAIYHDLRVIEGELRNQYRLIYKPSGLEHDGSFHHIALKAPARVASINTPSGYYAPQH